MQGLLLGAHSYGVVVSQFPIGYLSDKYGCYKLQLMTSIVILGLGNLLSPLIIVQLGDYYFLALRILIGIAGVSY